ncbi:hypothetical protein [Granulicoccus phenolivorans]|uniref:hypothetical protein n=1 Tax=Granulicoccus phenolivorans TaxID=266854 RepID=UPI00047A2479|nr:hypothetical protein [Granulicoccus phenolivorans]
MRIRAVYDAEGVIVAAVELENGHAGPVPVATEPGHGMGTFDVPIGTQEADAELTLEQVCRQLRVDTASGGSELVEPGRSAD